MKSLILIAALTATPALAQPEFRVGMPIGSWHFGGYASEFNQVNLGISLGVTFQQDKAFQYGAQVGVYNNSYSERTIYALGFADYRMFEFRYGEIRAGAFAGLFEYADIAAKGYSALGDYVFIAGPQLTYRTLSGADLTVGYIPQYSKRVNGILTLSVSVPFALVGDRQ